MSNTKSYFFCGIGGSGMLPLATILAEQGAEVAGSDRALDQGRLGAKFEYLQARGMDLFAQDGSGLTRSDQILVASAAVEDSVPDVAKAKALGCVRMTRAQLLAQLFNASPRSVAVGGTSGKSTVTGMIGWIASKLSCDPTIMNGAVMRNFADADAPFASSRVGKGGLFISEVDESDGSIALFQPEIAVLNNITLDHKSLDELRQLFGDFAARAKGTVWNADDPESVALMANKSDAVSFGFAANADFRAVDMVEKPLSVEFRLLVKNTEHEVRLAVPGRHNAANALAALAASAGLGLDLEQAVAALGQYKGLARRFEIVGTERDITVIDDFGHNPDKISATLDTLKAFPGRVIAFFQPHGFGPLRVMGKELAEIFAAKLDRQDRLFLCDPVYFGGTVDKSIGSDSVVADVNRLGTVQALHVADRAECGRQIIAMARPGDRIVIMGARDDTLSAFATEIVEKLRS
ncbi:glutamate ligase domain-containing protein [Sphingorhabdus contaminans]|uniref:UDP-N-acetylmuramate--alanine ligase n=1 Tax=Sphingorhabdus contaminans TaxID=1343899 RepID=A0A553WGW5_9SPHN|nr:Mur ligase family protein [Sphingorhabdus contaminans]TSB03884.1 UDP-N-acetylmuramate--alanine ligase [Sphingorhabdus contaminans]